MMLLHITAFLIVVYFPITQLLFAKKERERLLTVAGARVGFYRNTTLTLWVVTGLVVLAVVIEAVPWRDLGFTVEWTWQFILASSLVLGSSLALLLGSRVTETNYSDRKASYEHVRYSLPHTPQELRYMIGTAVTAGISEEIIYRAFLFWYFSQYVDFLAAVVIANIAFSLGHIWSGPKNMFGAFVLGMVFSTTYLFSGSLLPAIVLHAFVDIHAGLIGLGLARQEGLDETTDSELHVSKADQE